MYLLHVLGDICLRRTFAVGVRPPGGAAAVPASAAHGRRQAVATDGPLVMPEKKQVVMPMYCESVYQSIRRPTRTIHVRLPAGCPTGPLPLALRRPSSAFAAREARAAGRADRAGAGRQRAPGARADDDDHRRAPTCHRACVADLAERGAAFRCRRRMRTAR